MKTKPKMILFDYGHTLLCEAGFNSLRGKEALFRYIKNNKNNLTPAQIDEFAQDLFNKIRVVREVGMEIHQWHVDRLLCEYLEIEFSVPPAEAESIFWNNASCGTIMPNADKMLDYINANGIRSGVISNIGWSGTALAERINRLLPRNRFEFIIASSECVFRKPNPMLFELALKKAGLDASDVWFCGDSVKNDVEAAAAVDIFPVWYDDDVMDND